MGDLPSWEGAKRIAFDVETRDQHLKELGPGDIRDGYMVGYSFAIEDGPCHYIPFRHEGGDNVDETAALAYLLEQAANYDGVLVGANMSYDLGYCVKESVKWPKVQYFRDVQVAEPLLDEHQFSYSLQAIAERHGFPGKEETALEEAARMFGVSKKGGLWRLPARHVGSYAEQDARLPLQLLRRQEKEIDNQDLWEIYNLESELLPVLVDMRRRGVAVDWDRFEQMEAWTLERQKECLDSVQHHTGCKLSLGDVNKASALAPVFEKIGIKLPLTSKSKKPSIKGEVLEQIDHPIAEAIVAARSMDKLRGTFCGLVRKFIVNGRIHSSFNQLRRTDDEGTARGTITGRCSSDNPNIQFQPIRSPEFGYPWRGIYIPDTDEWVCCDFSQQEPRLTVHYAELCGLPGAQEAGDAYRDDPNTDHHAMMAKLTNLHRKVAKAIFLGLVYGMGGAKLCRQLGLPTAEKKIRGVLRTVAGPEGQVTIDRFNDAVPFVKYISKLCEKQARRKGFVRTIGGRKGRFQKDAAGNYDWTYKALNKLIQGSAADQMKKAMVMMVRAGILLQIQVHDEIDFSPREPREADDAAQIMRDAIPLSVPVKVDIERGASWGEINDEGRAKCKEFYA